MDQFKENKAADMDGARELAEKLAKLPEHKKEIVLAFMQGLQYEPPKEKQSA